MFDLNKFANNIAVETEQGKKMAYAQLEKDANAIAEVIKPRKFTFCLCENTLGSFVGYVAFMTHNIPTVLLDGSKDMGIVLGLANHYMPEYIWIPTSRVDELGHGEPVFTYEDYTLINWQLPLKSIAKWEVLVLQWLR